jgi:glycosyltransferase involved in cell wall biosynthesis
MLRTGKWASKWIYDMVFGQHILNDAAMFVAETNGEARDYIRMGISKSQIRIITPPLDLAEFDNLPSPNLFRDKYGIKKRYILSLGRIHKIKGLGFLMESFSKLHRDDVTLVIAGADSGYKKDLEKLVHRLGIDNSVVFTGFITGEDKLSALRGADVVTQTSIRENGNNMPFEAFLCGTPVISTRTSAGDDLRNINNGYQVDYGDVQKLAFTMNYVLEHPGDARVKAQECRRYIINNLSIESVSEKYEELYKNILT